MANQIIEDVRAKIKEGNTITQLIVLNVSVFLSLSILKILLVFTGSQAGFEGFISFIELNLSIPLSFHELLYKPWTLITYMFTQTNPMHLLFNMVFLYWFGEILTRFTSDKKIIPLYLLGGIAGALISITLLAISPNLSPFASGTMIGASAGISAIIIAAATLVPNFKVNMILIGPVKLLYLAIFVLFLDILNISSYANVAGNLSHLGGALMGYIFIVQYKKGKDLSIRINNFLKWAKDFIKNGSKRNMKVAHKRPVSDEDYNYNKKVNQQEVDAILDKIAKSGYESLSKTEKEKLFRESKK